MSERAALKVIVCGRNRLENEGATALAQTFEKLGTLEEVSLYQNGINASGISALARSFTTNTSLRYVDLNDNTFTAEGGKAMAQVLPRLSVLEFLNFDDCLIRDAGVDAIAEVFEEHCARLRVSIRYPYGCAIQKKSIATETGYFAFQINKRLLGLRAVRQQILALRVSSGHRLE